MLESLGYPAVATASAAVAFSLGYDDGEKIDFETMLETIRRIAAAVDVPVSADIEGGYAETTEGVAGNIRQVLLAGAVGINLEDSVGGEGKLRHVDDQCERIRAVREMTQDEGIPLLINARVDVFLREGTESRSDRIDETIARASAYVEAGADCIYPIGPGDPETLKPILEQLRVPINVYASAAAAPMRELESLGVARLSLGPGMLRASLTAMKGVAERLLDYDSYESFTKDVLSSDEIRRYLEDLPSSSRRC
jgi:2-methylisocitrate lyase-like PEP mutase family enzyme